MTGPTSPLPTTRLLVSVSDAAEARLALAAGAGLIDAKDPRAGALGALDPAVITEIRDAVAGRATVTAVTGDHTTIEAAVAAAERIAATGVDLVKIGFPAALDGAALADALESLARRHRLVAVLFADEEPDFGFIPVLALAGFAGVMLDTAGKSGGLRRHLPDPALAAFVARAHRRGLMAGLAGSLRAEDLPVLAAFGPDLLGMRGGVCEGYDRTRPLDPVRVAEAAGLLAAPAALLAGGVR
ncbi:(5-formylfuran-3-yl)methyl phosphate synthase [Methylobrevis albus]|uniref:(5-formylfuran-3-yl)methyl phosphate synthase n=1 Tax=Methylobrevis albus TaxID=2793297 RepID=A0A931I5G1_9HYPH|nr:(5-formylfuran-3-yl)methyl phosphate synthase [Methylobrevis albus]MBH0239641.1 (5-formylfuran-3-yl)methyl phosphate synthase [Methylobrevis albus]